MTSPDRNMPARAYTPSTVASMQNVTQKSVAEGMNGDMFGALTGAQGGLGGLLGLVVRAFTGGLFGTLGQGQAFAEQQNAIINDHTQTIQELRAEVDTLTIHGTARTLSGDGTYLATPGTVRAEVIMLAGGAGGGTGAWNVLGGSQNGGFGGGGGGEVHFTINGAALFNEDGSPRPIAVTIGRGGQGATVNEGGGTGGGNTTFDGIIAYGGQGGTWGNGSGGGAGGFGLVKGGFGSGGSPDSLSGYELYGGGGAGGRGAGGNSGGGGSAGGRGGLNPGGTVGNNAPTAPLVTATGGGGGGGGAYQANGGAGSAPSGGGGGGGGAGSNANRGFGGPGAQGIIFIIERMV